MTLYEYLEQNNDAEINLITYIGLNTEGQQQYRFGYNAIGEELKEMLSPEILKQEVIREDIQKGYKDVYINIVELKKKWIEEYNNNINEAWNLRKGKRQNNKNI